MGSPQGLFYLRYGLAWLTQVHPIPFNNIYYRDGWGITPGNINNLVEHFERQASPLPAVSPTRSLKSPTRQSLSPTRQSLKSPDIVNRIEKSKSPSPQRNTVKTYIDQGIVCTFTNSLPL